MNDASASRTAGDAASGSRGAGPKLAALTFGVISATVVLEIALRLAPGVISPRLLILFEPGLRERIASGAYPLQKDFLRIERDDGGPPLFVAKPETRIVSIDPVPDGSERFTDEIGFCNPPGRYVGREQIDVIALGDSFTWCHGVVPERAWPALLGERIGATSFSLGRGGNGPYEYLQYFLRFGLTKHPRVVILNVYGGNDLRDAAAWRDYHDAIQRGEPPPVGEAQQLAPALVSSVLGRHSYALNLALAVVSRVVHRDPGDWEKHGIDFGYQVLLPTGPVDFNIQNRDRDEIVSARRVADGSTPLAIWDEAFARFGALAREHGFTAIVAYTPSAWSAYDGHVGFADPSLEAELGAFDRAQRGYLAAHAQGDGYLFYDLTADLRRAAAHDDPSGLLYDPVHVHLSARGNEVVAESLARFLDDRGLLERRAPVAR